MRPLSVTAFMDGRPGHEKQTKGVLGALQMLTDIQVLYEPVPAQDAITLLKRWFSFTTMRVLSPKSKHGYDGDVDLVLGTGSRIHLAMILYQRRHGGRLVTCMTPDLIVRNSFDLCLVPQHDKPRETSNIFITVGPPVPANDLGRHDAGKGLILVGGIDSKSHYWESEKILTQIRTIVDRQEKVHWTISSSPRTPDDMIQMLDRYAASVGGVTFFRSQQTPAGWIESAYAQNTMVWVTADSVSMVYEALSAGCRVGILPVKWKHSKNKFQRSIDSLSGQERIITYGQWLAGCRPFAGSPLDEARRCAEEILQRWWPERL